MTLKTKRTYLSGVVLAALLGGGLYLHSATAQGVLQSPTAPTGKVTPWSAIQAVNDRVPGWRVVRTTYKYEDGRWIYSLLLLRGNRLQTMTVYADTGDLGEPEAVTTKQVTAELREMLTTAAGKGR